MKHGWLGLLKTAGWGVREGVAESMATSATNGDDWSHPVRLMVMIGHILCFCGD